MFTMASAREARPRYDEQYKQLFAFPRMVEDLLRAFVGDLLGASDFSTLRKLSSDYISDERARKPKRAPETRRIKFSYSYPLGASKPGWPI